MARGLRAIVTKLFLGVLTLASLAQPASAEDFDCAGFLRMHGMLRRASMSYGFTSCNPGIVDRARTCFDRLGSRRGAEAIRSGAAEFEGWGAVRNRDAVCKTLVDKMATAIAPTACDHQGPCLADGVGQGGKSTKDALDEFKTLAKYL